MLAEMRSRMNSTESGLYLSTLLQCSVLGAEVVTGKYLAK